MKSQKSFPKILGFFPLYSFSHRSGISKSEIKNEKNEKRNKRNISGHATLQHMTCVKWKRKTQHLTEWIVLKFAAASQWMNNRWRVIPNKAKLAKENSFQGMKHFRSKKKNSGHETLQIDLKKKSSGHETLRNTSQHLNVWSLLQHPATSQKFSELKND